MASHPAPPFAIPRPRLADAPPGVRAAVEGLLGGPIGAEQAAEAGFTHSIASVVTGRCGRRLFVKAAAPGDAVEAGIVLAAVTGEIGPRLAGSAAVGDWRVAAYEVIEGETLTRWQAADLPELLRVVRRMRELLDPSPIAGTSPYAQAFLPLLGAWQAWEHTADHPPLPVDLPVALLAELERRWLTALAGGGALQHGDLRRDNVIRQPDGRLRIVDWTHRWTAPGWMDLVRLAPDLAACGHDPEQVLRRSCWRDAPAGDVNVALAGLAGRAWRDGHLPDLPGLRRMQREQGLHLLRWLDRRLRVCS
ncbi:aminoglycoside phosphotransferase [Actinoplanes sp. NPDC024001]|uniref:aminoglycoside phosphotransferase n=1 Tax=Actinoplanes sp. NPDC024001 TaxID=3154598 RepID=UPI0033C21CF3